MYKQSMDNIKTIIIPIDGVIFNLNEKRYEIYKELCNKHNVTIDKTVFYNQLCNMYDMYNGLPLLEFNNYEELNNYIEDKLHEYIKYNFLKTNDGLLEIVHYSNQKDIKIAIITTHKTNYAVSYLKKANIYNKVQYIIGSDSHISPLPSCTMISSIMRFFEVTPQETLVISSFDALTKAANELNTNVICIDDFVKYNPNGEYYKKVTDLYDAFNTIMFSKYESYTMFSNLLGMNEKMDKEELKHRKEVLEKDYANEPSILNVVEHTYSYHISMLNEISEEEIIDAKKTEVEQEINEIEDIEDNDNIIEEMFGIQDQEETEDIKSTNNEEEYEDTKVIADKEVNEDTEVFTDEAEVNTEEIIEESNSNEIKVSTNTLSDDVGAELSRLINGLIGELFEDEDDLNETVKERIIKEPESKPEKVIEEKINEEVLENKADKDSLEALENKVQQESTQEVKTDKTKKEEPEKKSNIFIFFGVALILSVWILVIGILIYVLFGDMISAIPELAFIPKALNTYYSYASLCIQWILDSLHSFIPFIPNYEQYINAPSLSEVLVLLINLFTANTVIISVILGIKELIFRNKK